MRPTRWTRARRATYRCKGGWSIHRFGFFYQHPVTGMMRRFLTDTLSLPVWLWWVSNVGFLLIGVAAGSFL